MNVDLLKPGTKNELYAAIASMGAYRALGLDGLTPLFYQSNLNALKTDVVEGFNSFLSRGHLLKSLNQTNLVLIPKMKRLTKVSQFCPIALCNMIYKNFSKVIANRLKVFLLKLISENQSAFVHHRMIQDNVILAHVLIHVMTTEKRKEKHLALKLDMAKTYDRVEWKFQETML
ncbi:uncharacterized protein LOC132288949 [Cornus florida]|uniref:uncharacterized protein LOC132288949 n=1 Tax=Cornus florida TaxID=4283 RepID=UPI00289B8659|nr:uncharacterized protein LOC132288949 [Cornus florida]